MGSFETITLADSLAGFLNEELPVDKSSVIELAEGELDPRLKNLSYSSLLTLHECPRKFQLYRLRAPKSADSEIKSVTFAFGHVVGLGIQLVLQGKQLNELMLELFQFWDPDLLAEDTKKKKSFFLALAAVLKFRDMHSNGFLDEWELAYVTPQGATETSEDVPACELSFRITVAGGFKVRGFVDAVLVHKETGAVMVLELKTTGAKYVDQAMYKNSSQAVGYSVILDYLYPGLTDYQVLYLVYKSSSMEFETLPFEKGVYERAGWVTELMLDTRQVETYATLNYFPTRGESCYNYFSQCEYFTTCKLDTASLTAPLTEATVDELNKETYMFEIDLEDLIQTTLERI